MFENAVEKFIKAVKTQDIDAAISLIETSGLLDSNNWLSRYKFIEQDEGYENDRAIQCNSDLNLLRLLLHRASKEFVTKMLWGAITKQKEILASFLLEDMPNKIDANAYDEDGKTALHMACEHQLIHLVYILLDHDADIHAKCTKPLNPSNDSNEDWENAIGETALHLAAKFSDSEMIQILLTCGADVHATDAAGSTCLHLACYCYDFGNNASVLLKAGANCNVKDNRGRTPLHVAAKKHNASVIKTLLEDGADANITCNDAMTPLDYAALEHPLGGICNDVDVLKKHIITMKALDLYVSDSNLKHVDLNGKDRQTFEQCKKNLGVKICRSNISFNDFLTGSTKQLMVYLDDEDLCEALENFSKKKICCNDHAIICHPWYRSLILARYQRKERMLLLSSSLKHLKTALFNLFGKELPEDVLLHVVECCGDEELKDLIKSAGSKR